jgi:YbbR domain-containing protein
VRRILGRLVHNWPLKLAALGLATLMYGGLALSQNTQTFSSPIPVRVINQPDQTVLLTQPEHVTLIRYFAPSGVPVGPSTFRAFVDLDGVPPTGQLISVHIEVDSPDGRVRVLSYEPAFATIQLDKLTTNEVPVKVEHGAAPAGLELGPVTVVPTTVTISGAASLVRQVVFARADVLIDPTGLDVDQEVELIPIDGGGVAVRPVDVTPATARVTIPVFTNRTSKSLPVNPVVTGTPAAGFEIASVSVAPEIVLVEGDADQLATLAKVDTKQIPIGGLSSDETVNVALDLPNGVVPVGTETISVTIKLRPVTATRAFTAGVSLIGAHSDLTYDVAVPNVILTVGGSPADLDRLAGASIVAQLDVTTLGPGTTDVPVSADLPAGTTLVSASPPSVRVTITGPAASPGPGASAVPSPSGG